MQPLKILTNVQKARLLHTLIPEEIPEFMGFLNELTETVLNDRETVIAQWEQQIFSVEMWFNLAEEVQTKMAKYGRQLYGSPNLFADQLFDGFTAIFCTHALAVYAAQGKSADPKFKTAVDLLFNP